MRGSSNLCAPAALVFLALIATPAAAAWPSEGLSLPRAIGAPWSTPPALAADGLQGAYVAFGEPDSSGAWGVRVFRVDAAGNTAAGWPVEGLRVGATGPSTYGGIPAVLPDGSGGVLLVWNEFAPTTRAYALRLTSAGAVATGWPTRGALVADAALDWRPVAADDGAGGVVVAWRDPSGFTPGVYLQHLLGDGSLAPSFPASGRLLTSPATSYTNHAWLTLERDGTSGFWLSYTATSNDSVFAPNRCRVAHLLPDATPDPHQASGGLVLPVPSALVVSFSGYGVPVALALDGSGGTYAFAWRGSDLYAFHLSGAGVLDADWPPDGVPLATDLPVPIAMMAPNQNWPEAVADGAGGAYVAWADPANPSYAMATRIRADGTIPLAWTGGRRLDGSFGQSLVADAGGLFAAGFFSIGCAHFTCLGTNTLCRFDSSGAVAAGWPDPSPDLVFMPGYRLDSGTGTPEGVPVLCADGAGGAYATWPGVTGARLPRWLPGGVLDAPPAAPRAFALAGLRFVAGDGVRAAYTLPPAAAATLELFDVAGRRHARTRLDAGAGEITMPGTSGLAPGLYFARLSAGPRFAFAKVVVAR